MKLVIGGATGFVGREVLRQALHSNEITSIVTLGRRPVPVKDDKLTDIVMEDGEQYSETIAITPTKSKTTPFDIVTKVTRDYTLAGIDALSKVNKTSKPLRFIYFSGVAVSRDMDRDFEALKHAIKPEVLKLRCMLEIELVDYAAKSNGKVEVCCVRPGYILGDRETLEYKTPELPPYVPVVKREDLVAAVLKLGLDGIEGDPLSNEDLVRIGEEALPRFN
ncbi:hypothetical protein EG329_005698 [Mollisiaceae sp. DMI_Dod_QoI]|nr:hypothetical protein EG329_005698 [Helotiales sp. DMI_Dod_QoI]